VKPIGKELNVIYLRHASGYTKSLVVVKKKLFKLNFKPPTVQAQTLQVWK
jgi:hypothetical protein